MHNMTYSNISKFECLILTNIVNLGHMTCIMQFIGGRNNVQPQSVKLHYGVQFKSYMHVFVLLWMHEYLAKKKQQKKTLNLLYKKE